MLITYCSLFDISTNCGVTRKHWSPVHGPLLQTGSTDYLRTGPRANPTDPSTDHPQNKIQNRNKDFAHCLSNRSLVSAKFRVFTLQKCNKRGFSLRRKLYHSHCHFSFAVTIRIYERTGNLREATKFVLLSVFLRHFFRPILRTAFPSVCMCHFIPNKLWKYTVEPPVATTSPQRPVFENTKSFSAKSLHWKPLVSDHLS